MCRAAISSAQQRRLSISSWPDSKSTVSRYSSPTLPDDLRQPLVTVVGGQVGPEDRAGVAVVGVVEEEGGVPGREVVGVEEEDLLVGGLLEGEDLRLPAGEDAHGVVPLGLLEVEDLDAQGPDQRVSSGVPLERPEVGEGDGEGAAQAAQLVDQDPAPGK